MQSKIYAIWSRGSGGKQNWWTGEFWFLASRVVKLETSFSFKGGTSQSYLFLVDPVMCYNSS